ncbi:hypothetical protein [Undibacterium sp. SXout20W]
MKRQTVATAYLPRSAPACAMSLLSVYALPLATKFPKDNFKFLQRV